MNKNAIKKFAIEARQKLIASVTDKAGMLGITAEGISIPTTKGNDFEVYQTAAGTEITLNKKQCEQRRKLVAQVEAKGFENVVEEVAYTWFNRICAVRFMEVNDYLPSRVRVLSSEKEGKNEPDLVTQAPEIDLDLTDAETEFVIESKMSGKLDELFAMLFVKQCNKLHEVLPELFEETSDYTEMLLNISFTNKDDVVRMLIDEVPEADFNITTVDENGNVSGQVEIIGWLYQYYISEPKDDLINAHKKYRDKDIPFVTQLFTTDWIVKFIVENSLGRYWVENKESKILDDMTLFFNSDAKIDSTEDLQNIKVIDPCMGSGHILVYAFDILMKMYLESGFNAREAAKLIIQNNLYGLDIDKRAYQLAYFSIFMKARQYNRRIFNANISCNLCFFEKSKTMKEDDFSNFGLNLTSNDRLLAIRSAIKLTELFSHADVVGSLIDVSELNLKMIKTLIEDYNESQQLSFDSIKEFEIKQIMYKLLKIAKILSYKYQAVITNPPYLNSRYMPKNMKEYLDKNFADAKSDMFSAFIQRTCKMCAQDGHVGMLTPYVWMFISGYEELRNYLLDRVTISALVQLEYNAFESACVPVCAFTFRNYSCDIKGNYVKLSDFKGIEVQEPKTIEAKNNHECGYFYSVNQNIFKLIPGVPFAYWVSKHFLDNFNRGISIDSISDFTGSQHITADNEQYLRQWWEIDKEQIELENWKVYAKGGEFRKWYGNLNLVVDWRSEALNFYKNNKSSNLLNERYWNQEGITYTEFTSSINTFRYLPNNCIFDKKGPSIVRVKNLEYCLGLLNSPIADMYFKVFNPSVSTQVRDVKNLPIIIDADLEKQIKALVLRNIQLAKEDWDSYETSIDFEIPQLFKFNDSGSLMETVEKLQKYQAKCFEEMKINEEQINQQLIKLYNLSDELDYHVKDEFVSYAIKDDKTIVIELLSYIMGCILGRYVDEKLISLVDDDGIVPVTDDEYFDDDLVLKIKKAIKILFGEAYYEENIRFVASCLSNKNKTEDETIRDFFVKDFYNYHCKLYQKKPIYWQFSSGKENAFKALIYIHDYTADTVGKIRIDYLHKIQKSIEGAKMRQSASFAEGIQSSEKARITKQIEKYTKQLAEIAVYDEAMAHCANMRIELKLEDGVKDNYEKFQNIIISQEGRKSVKIDLLGKIR